MKLLDKAGFIECYKETLDFLNVKPEQLRVDAGGVLLMHGIRQHTQDLDLSIPPMLFDQMVKTHHLTVTQLSKDDPSWVLASLNERVDLHPNIHTEQGEWVDGVWCSTLSEVLMLKKRLNRPKDQKDIQAIEALIKKS